MKYILVRGFENYKNPEAGHLIDGYFETEQLPSVGDIIKPSYNSCDVYTVDHVMREYNNQRQEVITVFVEKGIKKYYIRNN